MEIEIRHVDAFTDRPFAGNPAAVTVLPEMLDDETLQHIANEMNLSETAYLVGNGNAYRLRWFTPGTEVELCGHATLASAHVLWTTGLASDDALRFQTLSGELTAVRAGEEIVLDFPGTTPVETALPAGAAEALGVSARRTALGKEFYVVEVDSEETVRKAAPDLTALKKIGAYLWIVTTKNCDERYDFVSRMFAPAYGVDEDPVTGAAHCVLGPYWKPILGKDAFHAYQASARGGSLKVRVEGDRVKLIGRAVTVMEGTLRF